MLKKTMTYEDLNGDKVTEDFYFALSKAELAELEITGGPEGFSGMLARIATEEDTKEMLRIFKDIIKMTVGRKSEDGKRFEKNDQITLEFMQCPAYSDLLMEFYTDAGAAAEFISGCVPSDLADVVNAEIGKMNAEVVELPDGSKDVVTTEPQKSWVDYERAELVAMSDEEWEKVTKDITIMNAPRALMGVFMERKAKQRQ